MSPQSDKSRQYGTTAATLLVAYMLVLQGLATGLVLGARAGQSALDGAVCLTARTAADETRQGPDAPAHRFDVCCIQQGAGVDGGLLGGVAELDAPRSPPSDVLRPTRDSIETRRLAVLPVGARAPPAQA